MKGYIEKKRNQVYRVRIHLGYDDQGKRITRSVTVFGPRRDAERKLTELLSEINAAEAVPVSQQTVAEFLDYWMRHYVRRLSARTQENYREYVEGYLKPGLGRFRLDGLKAEHIQAFYTKLELTGRKKGGALSPTTVFNAHRVLKGALKQAVAWRQISRNPAENVVPPRPAEREHKILAPEQVALLLRSSQGSRLYLPILMGLSTGMRRGEICGLRWQDVRLDTATLSIRQTLVRIAPGRYEFKTPKTRTGRRLVKLPSLLVDAMVGEKLLQEEARAVLGPSYNAGGLVVCREDGRPVDPATIYSNFQKLLIRLELPRIAIHDLRHSHATMLLEQGINPKTVAERLGHSDPALTLRVYSHVAGHIQDQAAEETDHVLRGLSAPKPE